MYQVNNKHTLHSLPQHNLLEFLLSLYHSIPSHFLMLQLVAQLDQPLIISNNSKWVWNNIVASRMKKTFETREHISNNFKVTLIRKYLHCTATLDKMHSAVEFHLNFHPPKETGFLTWSWGGGVRSGNHCLQSLSPSTKQLCFTPSLPPHKNSFIW